MKIDFKGILEGAWNTVFVKESIEKVHDERMMICGSCEHKTAKKTCGICGCFLEVKTRCLSCECPIKKWEAVASQKEDIEIDERLKKEESGENK